MTTGSIHITIVAHSLVKELRNLYSELQDPRVFWHIFLHSDKPAVMDLCMQIAQSSLNVYYYPYGTNRGLARSWNEGLIASRKMQAGTCIIANDDIETTKEDLFCLADTSIVEPDKYMISLTGWDRSTNEYKDLRMALCAFNPLAFQALGSKSGKLFDEQFEPIYYEDLDLYRRASLKGLSRLVIPNSVGTAHLGSGTRHAIGDEAQFMADFHRNQAKYIAKWGGDGTMGSEVFTVPYNLTEQK